MSAPTQASRNWLSFPSSSVRLQVTILSTAWTRRAWFGTVFLATRSKHLHTSTLDWMKCVTVLFSPGCSRRGKWTTFTVDFLSRWLKQSFYKAYPAKMKSKKCHSSQNQSLCASEEFFLSTATCFNKPCINKALTSFSYRRGQNGLKWPTSSSNWVFIRH